jgi:hypothetical protein
MNRKRPNAIDNEISIPAINTPKRPPPPGIIFIKADGTELAASINVITIMKRKSIPNAIRF